MAIEGDRKVGEEEEERKGTMGGGGKQIAKPMGREWEKPR
jgi:hypothetical protein